MNNSSCFSALQRAENSSLTEADVATTGMRMFQCSSASRKFLTRHAPYNLIPGTGFSALQRAENSSPMKRSAGLDGIAVSVLFSEPKIPHASRSVRDAPGDCVSVLFSEPKIPHGERRGQRRAIGAFQCSSASRKFLTRPRQSNTCCTHCFSALQRAENSSPNCRGSSRRNRNRFSALQRAENSSLRRFRSYPDCGSVSVLFSEPKIPHI